MVGAFDAAPGHDEIEITVLGPGRGECIVAHIGNERWLIADSCVGADGQASALSYLASLGVREEAVALLVATHWHDDHVRGFSQLVECCSSARVVISQALEPDEFFKIVASSVQRGLDGPSGVTELEASLELLAQRGVAPQFAQQDMRLLAIADPPASEVWALAPSSTSVGVALNAFASALPKVGLQRGAVARPKRNPACVVLLLRVGEVDVLLGADLESSSDPRRGWQAVAAAPGCPKTRAQLVKIPHHGSADADDDAMWEQLVCDEPHAALTPFVQGRVTLPRETDEQRIRARTPNAWLTRRGATRRSPRRPQSVQKLVDVVAPDLASVCVDPGRVTFRSGSSGLTHWRVDAPPPAVRL